MNVIGGAADAHQELEYVLEMPADHATALQDKLVMTGVPERSIRVTESWHAQSSRSDMALSPNCCQATLRSKPYTRFLPNTIRLGTYADSQYNVTIRRRPSAEAREIILISLSSRTAKEAGHAGGADKQGARQQSANQSSPTADDDFCCNDNDDDDGDGDDSVEPVTIPTCRCDSTECENYRTKLCEYFADNGTNYSNFCGAMECVHKQIVDALKLSENCPAGIINEDNTNTSRTVTFHSEKDDVTELPRAATPVTSTVSQPPKAADPVPQSQIESHKATSKPNPVTSKPAPVTSQPTPVINKPAPVTQPPKAADPGPKSKIESQKVADKPNPPVTKTVTASNTKSTAGPADKDCNCDAATSRRVTCDICKSNLVRMKTGKINPRR